MHSFSVIGQTIEISNLSKFRGLSKNPKSTPINFQNPQKKIPKSKSVKKLSQK
jgi:hypothetical protein